MTCHRRHHYRRLPCRYRSMMAYWFAPVLAAWHGLSAGKSLFSASSPACATGVPSSSISSRRAIFGMLLPGLVVAAVTISARGEVMSVALSSLLVVVHADALFTPASTSSYRDVFRRRQRECLRRPSQTRSAFWRNLRSGPFRSSAPRRGSGRRAALERVRWIPAGWPALRAVRRASARQRLEMVRLATAGNPRFELDSAEVDAGRRATRCRRSNACAQMPLSARRDRCPAVGADAFAGMTGWHRWQSLFELAHVGRRAPAGLSGRGRRLAAGAGRSLPARRHCRGPTNWRSRRPGRVVDLRHDPLDISATKIRARCCRNGRAPATCCRTLIAYIRHHHLYRRTESPMNAANSKSRRRPRGHQGQGHRSHQYRQTDPLFERIVVASGDSTGRCVRWRATSRTRCAKPAANPVDRGRRRWRMGARRSRRHRRHVMQPAIRSYYNLEELWGGRGRTAWHVPRRPPELQ